MDERIRSLRRFFIEQKAHHALRQPRQSQTSLAEEFEKEHTPALQRAVRRAQYILQREIPVVFPEERIALMRTVPETPLLYTQQEYDALRAEYWIHESGDFNNFCLFLIGKELGNRACKNALFKSDITKSAKANLT